MKILKIEGAAAKQTKERNVLWYKCNSRFCKSLIYICKFWMCPQQYSGTGYSRELRLMNYEVAYQRKLIFAMWHLAMLLKYWGFSLRWHGIVGSHTTGNYCYISHFQLVEWYAHVPFVIVLTSAPTIDHTLNEYFHWVKKNNNNKS